MEKKRKKEKKTLDVKVLVIVLLAVLVVGLSIFSFVCMKNKRECDIELEEKNKTPDIVPVEKEVIIAKPETKKIIMNQDTNYSKKDYKIVKGSNTYTIDWQMFDENKATCVTYVTQDKSSARFDYLELKYDSDDAKKVNKEIKNKVLEAEKYTLSFAQGKDNVCLTYNDINGNSYKVSRTKNIYFEEYEDDNYLTIVLYEREKKYFLSYDNLDYFKLYVIDKKTQKLVSESNVLGKYNLNGQYNKNYLYNIVLEYFNTYLPDIDVKKMELSYFTYNDSLYIYAVYVNNDKMIFKLTDDKLVYINQNK